MTALRTLTAVRPLPRGTTLLMAASACGEEDAVAALLGSGERVGARDNLGYAALTLAAERGWTAFDFAADAETRTALCASY